MSYVRARRLTEAARQLAAGATDILAVAIGAGYASHEAFTRAFREEFGQAPDAVRAQGHTGNIRLVEAHGMSEDFVSLEQPRFEEGRAILVAGLGERYTFDTNQGIPFLWPRFAPCIGHVEGQVGRATYGVCCNMAGSGSFEYVAGVEVRDLSDVPPELRRIRIPKQRYAVFRHHGHVSTRRSTVYTIWNKWLPQSGYAPADSPDYELYGEDFNGQTGTGLIEIWVPIKP